MRFLKSCVSSLWVVVVAGRGSALQGLVQSYVLRGIAPISALNRVVMFGVTAPPSDVVVNGRAASAQFIESAQVGVRAATSSRVISQSLVSTIPRPTSSAQ